MAKFHLEPFCFQRKVSAIILPKTDISCSISDAYIIVEMHEIAMEYTSKEKQLRKFVSTKGVSFELVDADTCGRQTVASTVFYNPVKKMLSIAEIGATLTVQSDKIVDQFISEQKADPALKHKCKMIACIYQPFVIMPDDFDCDDGMVWHAIEVLRTVDPWKATMEEFPRLIELGKKVQEAISAHFRHIAETEGLVAFEAKRAAMMNNK